MESISKPVESTSSEGVLHHPVIVMYCTSWCPDCRRARIWFRENNLEYVEVDVDADPRAAAQVKAWTGGNRVTPTFDIDGTIIVSFNEQKLREVLKDRLSA